MSWVLLQRFPDEDGILPLPVNPSWWEYDRVHPARWQTGIRAHHCYEHHQRIVSVGIKHIRHQWELNFIYYKELFARLYKLMVQWSKEAKIVLNAVKFALKIVIRILLHHTCLRGRLLGRYTRLVIHVIVIPTTRADKRTASNDHRMLNSDLAKR